MPDQSCRQNNSQTAAIGCGSMLIIALLIFFVGRWSHAPVREEVESLRTDVAALTEQVEELRAEVRAALVQEITVE